MLLGVRGHLAAVAPLQVGTSQMNGNYMISNYSSGEHFEYSTGHRGEYIDVYGFNISTHYSEVYWTMQPPIPLPAEFVARFAGKVVALTGYEVDSIRMLPDGTEESVRIQYFNPLL